MRKQIFEYFLVAFDEGAFRTADKIPEFEKYDVVRAATFMESLEATHKLPDTLSHKAHYRMILDMVATFKEQQL